MDQVHALTMTYLLFNLPEDTFIPIKNLTTDPGNRALEGVIMRPLGCWNGGFESQWGHGCLSCLYYMGAGRSGDRIQVGARFSAPVQTGPGAHPASYTMGNGSLSRG